MRDAVAALLIEAVDLHGAVANFPQRRGDEGVRDLMALRDIVPKLVDALAKAHRISVPGFWVTDCTFVSPTGSPSDPPETR
jgi:hypothetical protein